MPRQHGDRQRLSDYQRRRDRRQTPEPFGDSESAEPSEQTEPSERAGVRDGNSFVVHEHHARRLHWDLRLERDGVLVSWAVPRGLPDTPERNHLAVPTEDHPLEYGGFSGEIPAGQYGAGQVLIFDHGRYDVEKWTDREVKFVLHGQRLRGRYVLFATGGGNWMVHRMDPPADPDWQPPPDRLRPMRAAPGALPAPDQDPRWGYEFGWGGRRALVRVLTGRAQVRSAGGEDLTDRFAELRGLGEALGATAALFDGEIVAFGEDGRPSQSRLRRRSAPAESAGSGRRVARVVPVTFVCFDLLHLDGRSLLDQPYRDRRERLDALGLSELPGSSGRPDSPGSPNWQVPPWWAGGGPDVLRVAAEQGLPAVVAKRLDSPYRPGTRSPDWLAIETQPQPPH